MEWTLDKINQYITNGIEENLHLDYKGAHSLEKNDKKKMKFLKISVPLQIQMVELLYLVLRSLI